MQAVALGFLCAGIAAAGSARWISPAASTLPAGAPELRSIAGLGHLSTAWLDARTVWLAALGGYLAGGVGGWFAHVFTPKSTASAQYAIVRAVREKWAVAPKLCPLSYWPAAAARAMANPQVSMRTMLFVLLALPMGITGAEAIAAGAAWMVGLYVFLNLVATVRTAFAAGWWLRPTSLQPARFTGALVSRVLLIQVGIFVAALFAMAAIGRPALLHLAVGATVAWLPIYAATAMTACRMGLRPAHYAKKPSTAGRLSGKPV